MQDQFNRSITYLRISVTDKCNLRCLYCMPARGVRHLRHEDVLSFEEIAAFARTAVSLGIRKIRVTGGEPLVRRDIPTLVRMLADIDDVDDLSMTTNGMLLGAMATTLAASGLQRINVSLDTCDPVHYRRLTRGGDVNKVIEGIHAALEAGLTPVKLNCVIGKTPRGRHAQSVLAFGSALGLEVRFIRRMNLAQGHFSTVIGGSGGDCLRCNRLRLSCDGMVRPCLFNDLGFSVRVLGAEEAILQAIHAKPACGDTSAGRFHSIGG